MAVTTAFDDLLEYEYSMGAPPRSVAFTEKWNRATQLHSEACHATDSAVAGRYLREVDWLLGECRALLGGDQ